MKKEFAISISTGLVLLIASMPYASATYECRCPYIRGEVPPLQPAGTIPLGSSFVVQVTTDKTVEAVHINVTFPSELRVESIGADPYSSFNFFRYQNDTDWVDAIVAEAEEVPPPVAPILAEIGVTATQEGNHTINISSVINGEVDDVVRLTVIVIAVPGDVNGDEIVDYRDLVEVIKHWGEPDTIYDVDRDGTVGYSDLEVIQAHWTG